MVLGFQEFSLKPCICEVNLSCLPLAALSAHLPVHGQGAAPRRPTGCVVLGIFSRKPVFPKVCKYRELSAYKTLGKTGFLEKVPRTTQPVGLLGEVSFS